MATMSTTYKPYPSYKPSGIKWLGEIPAHWEVKRLKSFADVRPSNVDKKSEEGQMQVFLCNYVDVYYNERIGPEIDFMAATATEGAVRRFSLRKGDILITKDSESWSDIAVPAVVVQDLPDVLCGYHLALIRPHSICDGAFLSRAFSATGTRDQFQVSANGITRFGLAGDAIRSGQFALPPLAEQQAIAAFLDRETAKIDALVTKKERLIELLQEKRTALITRAVTRGLDSQAPMKDSGVEWLGEIPAHWEVKKVSRLFSIGSGTTPPTSVSEYYDGEIAWITTSELRESVITSTEKTISTEALKLFPALEVHAAGSVAVAMYGATIGRLGILGIPATVNQACCVFGDPKGIDAWFWFYWLQYRRQHLISLSLGGGQPNLSQEILKELRVPIPSLDEQRAITYFLDRETAKIDGLVEKISEAINRMKELRVALISAAVTGRIDVREESA